jgi:DNA-binding transcriptional regulator YdaS (Cro superfamily)
MFFYSNNVKIAVERLGGPTKAANAVGVSNATIHNWIKRARIENIDKARTVAKLCSMELQDLRPTR